MSMVDGAARRAWFAFANALLKWSAQQACNCFLGSEGLGTTLLQPGKMQTRCGDRTCAVTFGCCCRAGVAIVGLRMCGRRCGCRVQHWSLLWLGFPQWEHVIVGANSGVLEPLNLSLLRMLLSVLVTFLSDSLSCLVMRFSWSRICCESFCKLFWL